ncbi:amino acid ABC transporter substrate-binding protein [Chlorogloeopsis fritschii PCC 6912]|uniref:Amino acid ABC transporter substrate-binding protein n=2 Tax=Chlorogloeopsis fritschii TaxID=1124 RepID=A0A433MYG0_CHLFR|nr:amino acid ABC transporter substrate-binding protein [Chlorogloeopsis fritschii PCC 6912]
MHAKRMRFFHIRFSLLVLLLLSTSCEFRANSSVSNSLKIGTLLPLTGEISAYGIPMQKTANLLIKTVNACGGVMGKPVTLISVDDQSKPQVGAEAMSKLAYLDKVSGVVGGAGSATSAAAVNIAVRNQIVMISPSSTSPSFTERAKKGDFKGFWFRTAPPDTFQGPVIAQIAQTKGYKKVSILAVNNDYGRGLVNAFIPAFEALGGQIVNKNNLAFYPSNAITFNTEVLNSFQGNPDAVLLIDYSQTGSLVLRSIYERGLLAKTPLILSDGLKDANLSQLVGKSHDGKLILPTANITGTAPSAKGPAFSKFREIYKKAYNGQEPSIYDPNTWDATAALILAAESAKSTAGETIKEHIRTVTNPPGEKVSDVCQALDLIRQGKKINYEGAGSNVDFDSQGDVTGNYDIWTVAGDGSIKVVEQITPENLQAFK